MIATDMPTTSAEAGGEAQYTIDDLASVARVPSRTIRFYQSRGALMSPAIRGRVAYYGPLHAERLKLIAQLQDRGLRIDAIGDLLSAIDRGEMDLAEWLGVERQVQTPWANDQPRTVNEDDLYELAGSRRPGLISDLVRTRLVERHRDVYLVRSPALLGIAMKLEGAGIDLETAGLASALARKHLGRLSEEVVGLLMKRAGAGAIAARDLGHVFESLRPLGTEAVRVMFGRAMERELRKLYESGKMAKLPAKVRKSKRR